ncbi:hypothetical protein BV20DRAFT_960266 [Pilatotrama ljubarskyi]|nr:hypothetical protein BV20DRAFT_960266 [Pilatotrama ljubarskyi]
MAALRRRLLSIEDEFLTALSKGGEALTAFEYLWEQLQGDLDNALTSDDLDDETCCLAHTVATRISTLADTSIEILITKEAITDDLVVEVESILSQFALAEPGELGSSYTPSKRSASSPSSLKRSHGSDDGMLRRSTKRRRVCSERGDTTSRARPGPNLDLVAVSSHSSTDRMHISRLESSPAVTSPRDDLPAVSTCGVATKEATPSMRKRRRSEADSSSDGTAKRLCRGPRLHATSNPLSWICPLPSLPPPGELSDQADQNSRCKKRAQCDDRMSSSSSSNLGLRTTACDLRAATDVDVEPFLPVSSDAMPSSPSSDALDEFLRELLGPDTSGAALPHWSTNVDPRRSWLQDSRAVDPLSSLPGSPTSLPSYASSPSSTPSYPLTPRLGHIDRSEPHEAKALDAHLGQASGPTLVPCPYTEPNTCQSSGTVEAFDGSIGLLDWEALFERSSPLVWVSPLSPSDLSSSSGTEEDIPALSSPSTSSFPHTPCRKPAQSTDISCQALHVSSLDLFENEALESNEGTLGSLGLEMGIPLFPYTTMHLPPSAMFANL